MVYTAEMHNVNPALLDLAVAIDTLVPYPGNPRRGDVEEIAKSLERLGQYKPIVVREGSGEILAGNHTCRAAISLGWTHIAAVTIDVTDEQAKRIVLVDNRTGDLGVMDLEALLALLQKDEGDIEATGYSDTEVERLASQLDSVGLFGENVRDSVGNENELEEGEPASIQVGPYRFEVEEDEFLPWAEAVTDEAYREFSPTDARPLNNEKVVIRTRLGLDGAEPEVFKKSKSKKVIKAPQLQLGTVADLNIPLGHLKIYPGNPNQGDISAIAQSLTVNGQYRPIVVSSNTLHVLAGNNTYLAAMALGWSEIAAVLLDVTPEEERLIVLADNKLAQRASYDMTDLTDLLREIADDPQGTGFEPEDIHEILGTTDEVADAQRRIWIAVKHRPTETNWRVPCSVSGFTSWLDDLREHIGVSDEAVEIEIRRRLIL